MRQRNKREDKLVKDKKPAEKKIPEEHSIFRDRSELDPFEIEFLEKFKQDRGPRTPFVNKHGVVIGDHEYASNNSPLETWDENTDPEIMVGDEWVHPYKDIGFKSAENRDLFERGIEPQRGMLSHPDKDVAYELSMHQVDDHKERHNEN
jgi:hypothetical protein